MRPGGKPQLRILHAVEAFGGGQLELVRQLAIGGARAGHRIVVAHGTRPETPPDLGRLFGPDVELVPLRSWADRALRRQIRGPLELRRLVAARNPDLVHLHSSFAGATGALALRRGPPTVFSPQAFASTLHGLGRGRAAAYRAGERLVVRRAAATMASSPSEGRYAERLGANALEVVENGIVELDAEPEPRPSEPTEPAVIAAGRMVSQRRPEACARILGAVSDVARVIWVGDTQGARHESGLAALRSSGVELTGWIPRAEYLETLANASVYLHWTATDGQALSILEAMAADVVTVASDIPPSRDVLPPDQICATEEEAAALIRRILSNRDLAARMREEQRARRSRYGAARMVRESLELYDRLLAA